MTPISPVAQFVSLYTDVGRIPTPLGFSSRPPKKSGASPVSNAYLDSSYGTCSSPTSSSENGIGVFTSFSEAPRIVSDYGSEC